MAGAKNTGKMATDAALKALKPGETATDSLPGRGAGSIYFECRPSGVVAGTYRYMRDGKRCKLAIGNFKRSARDAGMTLAELRGEAQRLARIAQEHGDVKAYLEQQAATVQAERVERQRLAEAEAAKGSFADMFLDYIEGRRGKATPGVVKELERLYEKNLRQHDHIMTLRARDIRPDHIVALLNPISDRGAPVLAARMRSFLVAAFNHGLTAENWVGRASSKVYDLETNPAEKVGIDKKSSPVTRALSDVELRKFWETIGSTEGVGPVMALLFKFVVATGGQRIKNIIETTWQDYDLEAGTVRLIHRKGRGGQAQSSVHLVPLTHRAIQIIEQVRTINGDCPWPWSTNRKQHIVISSPTHAVADWLKSSHAVIDDERTPSFSPRDLRRTCTQLMQKHGIDDSLSDLLQAHGQTGVVSAHYRNNPVAALPKKRLAVELFDGALSQVLGEAAALPDNVVAIRA